MKNQGNKEKFSGRCPDCDLHFKDCQCDELGAITEPVDDLDDEIVADEEE